MLHVYPNGATMTSIHLGRGVVLQCSRCDIVLESMADDVISAIEEAYKMTGRAVVMVDSRFSQTMSTGFRDRVAEWSNKHARRVTTHLLQNSRLMVAAISLVNLLTHVPVAVAYSQLDDWERVILKELGTFDRRLLDPPPSQRVSLSA